MHTLGSTFMPPGFHAGGLRYHGMAPLVSHLKELGCIEARAATQTACFEAGVTFARAEGIVPATEANHAVRAAIDEALRCREDGVSRAILFNLCGHGHFDMQAYTDYFAGKLTDLSSELRLAVQDAASRNAQVAVAETTFGLAQEELRLARQRYQQGVADNREVLESQTRLAEASDNLVDAVYRYNLSRVELARARGDVRSVLSERAK